MSNGIFVWQLKDPKKKKKPLVAKCGEQPLKYNPKATYGSDKIPPLTLIGRQRELTRRLLAEKCECCEQTDVPLEAHHVNKLSNLKRRWQGRKEKPTWVRWMISRHRKTIFVCQKCHRDITYGRYDGLKTRWGHWRAVWTEKFKHGSVGGGWKHRLCCALAAHPTKHMPFWRFLPQF